jgi:hypothetical protein
MRPDNRTQKVKLIVAFRNITKAPKNIGCRVDDTGYSVPHIFPIIITTTYCSFFLLIPNVTINII